jgi:hypothetical protein
MMNVNEEHEGMTIGDINGKWQKDLNANDHMNR